MKKIGLITLHRWFNYGSMLQAYAENYILNNLGYDCELIDYTPPRIDNHRSYKLYNNDDSWNDMRVKYHNSIIKRKEKFYDFMKLYKCSKQKYKDDEELYDNPPLYDAYVTGSDQIWNVNMRIASKAFFLHFTESEKKYAFSTSIGRCREDKLDEYRSYIGKYNKIYMREKEGAKLIKTMCPQVEVNEMIDPTLIMSRNDWEKIIDTSRIEENKYIACYATLDDELDAMMPILQEIYNMKHIPIVLFGMVFPREKEWIINRIDVGPLEFIRLVRDAEMLITHSFHGTAFALNFNVPFMTYNDALENPRKEGVLKMVGMQNRIVHNISEMKKIINEDLDFCNANIVLQNQRKIAKEEMKKCLGE